MGLREGDTSRHPLDIYRAWLLPIVIVVVSGIVVLADDPAREWLRYDRDGIVAGQLWRLLSGHFVHLGILHFLLNSAGLLLVWHLVGSYCNAAEWLLVVTASILCMDIGFWWLEPQLAWYVGLSGLLHGVLAAGIVAGWSRERLTAGLLAIMLLAKLVYEQMSGPLPGSEAASGGAVVIAAHLYGAIGGTLSALLLLLFSRHSRQSG